MEENLKIGIKGYVTILKDSKIVYEDNNLILGDAFEIILRCLANVPNQYNIDTIMFQGDDFFVNKTIIDTIINVPDNSIEFRTVALEDDFAGIINTLILKVSGLELYFASKQPLEIEKDQFTRIEVRWKIKLNNCI
jgi:hypothetical protein